MAVFNLPEVPMRPWLSISGRASLVVLHEPSELPSCQLRASEVLPGWAKCLKKTMTNAFQRYSYLKG